VTRRQKKPLATVLDFGKARKASAELEEKRASVIEWIGSVRARCRLVLAAGTEPTADVVARLHELLLTVTTADRAGEEYLTACLTPKERHDAAADKYREMLRQEKQERLQGEKNPTPWRRFFEASARRDEHEKYHGPGNPDCAAGYCSLEALKLVLAEEPNDEGQQAG
jgi:hypothetical protein